MRWTLAASVSVLLAVGITRAQPARSPSTPQSTSALINQQLDQRIALSLDNSALPEVLASIEKQTGVPIRVARDVYELLPYGAQTPITATILNLPLRDALSALCAKLGLRVEPRDEWVELAPEPALRRIGRRATLQELRTLDVLASRELEGRGRDATSALALTQAIDAHLSALDAQLAQNGKPPTGVVVELRSSEGVDPAAMSVRVARDATLRDALDALAAQTPLAWYPWGDSVVVLSKRSVVRAQLDRPRSLRYDGVDVAQVLSDLAEQTGMPFMIEPGAIQRVPPEYRIITLSADAPLRQSLESLQGFTGLGYVATDEGIYVWNANSTPGGGQRARVAAIVGVEPNTQVIVYEDDISAAARDALRGQRRAAIDALEKSLATSRPTKP